MECKICGHKKTTGNQEYMKCPKCGCEQYEPVNRADLYKRRQVTFLDKLIAAILFKLYDLSVWFTKKMEKEVRRPRLGNP